MKNTDSRPSRPTAKKAIATSASAAFREVAIDASTLSCSAPLIDFAADFIQKTIEVRMITATRATALSNISCWRCGNSALA